MKRYIQLGLILCVILMVSCTSQSRGGRPLDSSSQSIRWQADRLYAIGEYAKAASLYQKLAEQPSGQQNVFRLQAAHALFKMGFDGQAKGYVESINSADLSLEQRNQLYLLMAQIDLSAGNAEQAINYLQLIQPFALTRDKQLEYRSARAFAFALTGQLEASARERIILDAYLLGDEKNQNNISIIEILGLLPAHVQESQLSLRKYDIYSGWLELASIIRKFNKGSSEFNLALDDWMRKYKQHPGLSLIASGYFFTAIASIDDINEIAVFLPESGPYVTHAQAVKEGIMAAYYQYELDVQRPNLHFYDTQSKDIVALYHEAIAGGAQLIIGPLNKQLITQLAVGAEFAVPVLALNYVEDLFKVNLYQFALSPLDEVRQTTNQARFEGHKNAIILAPNTVEGERLATYFKNAWNDLEGNVLGVQTFDQNAKDFSFPVRQMLNINESQYRIQALSKFIANIQSNPYRRQDVDVIFMVAPNKVARLINPQFYHNRAEAIAVYGLSRVYGGQSAPKKDIDLEGVAFCSIPWLFEQAYQGDLDKRTLQKTWEQFPDSFLSLMAFGIDAYNVVAQLNKLDSMQYQGATGGLSLNTVNRIERRLVCAKFKQGEVLLLDAAETVPGDFKYNKTSAPLLERDWLVQPEEGLNAY
ncbi:MAG: penicillin-binding protein activator [Methyloprofundus sp.]|nr:penicillin-binding protein activator [Methyloprofundus sp.]MBW6452344.1 penicillin-binding protein activator [Methyloprofundus sp.]